MSKSQEDISPACSVKSSELNQPGGSIANVGELVIPRRLKLRDNAQTLSENHMSSPVLEARCLGVFQARIEKHSICQWWSNKAKSIFKYIATSKGRAVSKEMLMDAFWPHLNPYQANNNLKTSIQSLRQILSSTNESYRNFPWILFWDGKYMINPLVNLQVDIDLFEGYWNEGNKLEKASHIREAIRKYRDAVDLYAGDFFEEDPYDDWALVHREILKDIYLTILGKLADYSMQSNDYQECISFCHKILIKDRCREDIYQKLMCCYNRLGQKSTAARWYRICEWAVKDGLDAIPSQQTCSLHHKLLSNEYI